MQRSKERLEVRYLFRTHHVLRQKNHVRIHALDRIRDLLAPRSIELDIQSRDLEHGRARRRWHVPTWPPVILLNKHQYEECRDAYESEPSLLKRPARQGERDNEQ